jgi:nicotinate-nucleotide adenylyltransferase
VRTRPDSGLAILGGTFDPPHRTHRRIAEAALEQLPVAEVAVLPAGDHPHKGSRRSTAALDRLAMCRLAFARLHRVRVDDREVLRKGVSYTVDTLEALRAEAPDRALYFLIGSDNLPLLPTWKDHHRVLELCTVATFPRQGHPICRRASASG